MHKSIKNKFHKSIKVWMHKSTKVSTPWKRCINLSKTSFNSMKNIFRDGQLSIQLKTKLLKCFMWPSGVASQKFWGARSFDFKRAAVFCKRINSFFGNYFYYLVNVSPTYSTRLPQGIVFNHITCNLPITKTMRSVTYKDKKHKTDQPTITL